MAVQFFTSANSIDTAHLPGPFASNTSGVTIGIGDGVFGINTVHCASAGNSIFCGRILLTPGDGSTGFTVGFGFTPTTNGGGQFLNFAAGEGGLVLNSDGSLTAIGTPGSGTSFGSAAGAINIGQRNYVEFECPAWSTSSSFCRVYVGGVLVASGTLGSFIAHPLFGPSPLTSIAIGAPVGGCILDSIYVLDTTGTVNIAPLGPIVVGLLRPAAPGTKAQWTPNGAGTDWQAVNNVPPDGDTAYISDNTLNDECSVELTTPSIFASVQAVSVVTDARQTVAGPRTIAAGVGNGTSQSYGGNIPLNTTYATNTTVFNDNPNNSNLAWTLGDINVLQAAVKLTT